VRAGPVCSIEYIYSSFSALSLAIAAALARARTARFAALVNSDNRLNFSRAIKTKYSLLKESVSLFVELETLAGRQIAKRRLQRGGVLSGGREDRKHPDSWHVQL
jgi:hypothetical protein